MFRVTLLFFNLKVKTEQDSNGRELSPHTVTQCITALCSATGISPEDTQLLCLEALFVAHHPLVMIAAPNLWMKIVKHHNLIPKDFVMQQRDFFKKQLIHDYKVNNSVIINYFVAR